MRASAENLEIARLVGVDRKKMMTVSVVIASGMGGIGGVVVGVGLKCVGGEMGLWIGLKGLG
ncbi:ABC transporter permease subunit, partial [Siminovitchia fortis]